MQSLRPAFGTVQQAAQHFGADPDRLRLINAGVNTVYQTGDLALRLCSETFKDCDYLAPPLAWLRHLHLGGAWVCEPLSTPEGRWITAVPERPTTFLATASRWVVGPRLSDLPPAAELYHGYGRSIGRLHRVGQDFRVAPGTPHMLEAGEAGVFPRWDWLWMRAARHVGTVPGLARAFERLTPEVLAWADEDALLTHGDLRPGNVIWNGDRAVVIDFDEPVLGPAALDLARAGLELGATERPGLMSALLRGYRQERPLDEVWERRLPTLMAARAALMSAWSVEGGETPGPESGSGAVVSLGRLMERLDIWDF